MPRRLGLADFRRDVISPTVGPSVVFVQTTALDEWKRGVNIFRLNRGDLV